MIPGVHRSNILYSFKEAINNILNHSEASHASITFSVLQNTLKISLLDNGKGIPNQIMKNSTGNGLYNMKQRLNDINGSCTITTSSKGTLLLFTIKL